METALMFGLETMFQPLIDVVTFCAGLAMLIYFVVSLYLYISNLIGGL